MKTMIGVLSVMMMTLLGCGGAAFTSVDDDAGAGDDGGGVLDGPIGIHPDGGAGDGAEADGRADGVAVADGGQLVELAVASSTGPVPTCGLAWNGSGATVRHDGLHADPVTCGCACGTPNVPCTVRMTVAGGGPPCGPIGSPQTYASGQCAPYSTGNAYNVDPPLAGAGSCSPQPTVTKPAATWDRVAVACVPSVPGTPPAPDPGFHVCKQYDGDVACPAGPYNAKTVEYTLSDTRQCSACSCGAASGVTCGGVWKIYSDQACTAVIYTHDPPEGYCHGYSTGVSMKYQAAPSGGSCAPSSVTSTGTATQAQPTTFCCLP